MDGGNHYWRSPNLPGSREDEFKVKAALVAEAFALSKVDALGLGVGELALGLEPALELARRHELPYVVANLECEGEQVFPGSLVVERDGVKMGFVGAFVGNVAEEGCTVGEPVAAAAAAARSLPADVDVVVALGSFSAQQGTELVEAAPQVGFVVSASGVSARDAQPLTPDAWLLSTGARGQRMGHLTGTIVPGAKGWRGSGARKSLELQRDRFAKRAEVERKRLEKLDEGPSRVRFERRIQHYEAEVARLDGELEVLEAPRDESANEFDNKLETLNRSLDDHPAVRALIDAAAPAMEAAAQRRKVDVNLPAPPNPRDIIKANTGAGAPIKVKRLGARPAELGGSEAAEE